MAGVRDLRTSEIWYRIMSDGVEQPQDPFVVACIPTFNEEGSIAWVVVQARMYVDRVVVCDDRSIIGWLIHDSYIGTFF